MAVSTDGGKSYGARVRLGEGRWKIDGCPLKRTAIAAAGPDVYTAWYTAGQEPAGVYFARSMDGGRSFQASVPMHPDAAVSDAPSVAATGDGMVFVAWHGKTGAGRRVFLRVSTDRGATFSPVIEVPTPAGTAAYPEIVAAAGGTAWLAWQQEQVAYVMPVTVAAPNKEASRVTPIDAAQFAGVLAAERGRVVLVNFWATWCRPCLEEIPGLRALAASYGDRGFVLVPVALDDPADLSANVVPFLGRFFPDYRTYARLTPEMDGMVSVIDPAWNEILPTSYVLDRSGRVSARLQGGKPAAAFAAAIEPLLAGAAPD